MLWVARWLWSELREVKVDLQVGQEWESLESGSVVVVDEADDELDVISSADMVVVNLVFDWFGLLEVFCDWSMCFKFSFRMKFE